MPINNSVNQDVIKEAIAHALDDFYSKLIEKVRQLEISSILKRKNPYLFKAKGITSAVEIVDGIMSAFVSSSEETIFGNVFFEPIALAASNGMKAIAEGIDIEIQDETTIYAIAVKSGPNIFNADSKKRQEQNFLKASKLAQQAKKRFDAIIGYSYGKKKVKPNGRVHIFRELAGQEFWEELTGDPDFYKKLITYMDGIPDQYVKEFQTAYQEAQNRLVGAFVAEFCDAKGAINWEKLVEFNSKK